MPFFLCHLDFCLSEQGELFWVYTYNLNILWIVILCVFSYICIYLSRLFIPPNLFLHFLLYQVCECVQGYWNAFAFLFSIRVLYMYICAHARVCKWVSIHLPVIHVRIHIFMYLPHSHFSLSFFFPTLISSPSVANQPKTCPITGFVPWLESG